MDHLKYPIIFGCYDKPDKVLIAGKDKRLGGYTLTVCRLKKDANYGDAIDLIDCGGIIAQMNFRKLESAKAFLESVEYLVEEMEKEHDRGNMIFDNILKWIPIPNLKEDEKMV